jgi:hypothetical protein
MALGGLTSTCLNHPGIEAVGRCKQCGKPYCSACKIAGPTGLFCSDACKQKHEAFVQRAQQLESRKAPLNILAKIRKLIGKILVLLILLAFLVVVGIVLPDIPVLGTFAARVREFIGM